MADVPRPARTLPRAIPWSVPTGAPDGRSGPRRFPEPPALEVSRPGAPRSCASCAAPVAFRTAPPLCWGCGRALCVDCYWRHGLTHSAHTCTACEARGVAGPMMSRSGARRTAPRSP